MSTVLEHVRGDELPKLWQEKAQVRFDKTYKIIIEVEGEQEKKEASQIKREKFWRTFNDIQAECKEDNPEEIEADIDEAVQAYRNRHNVTTE